jgi:hypothetical protein
MKFSTVFGLAVAILFATASPALAQDAAEDWDLAVDPGQELTLASLDFGDNALTLRCKAGVLDFLLTGTPLSTEAIRAVRVTAGGIADERQAWHTQPGLPVLSASEPDRLARQLRAGGDLDVRIEPVTTGERALRFRLTLPASGAALDRVLSACGASLTDEWDLRPRAGGTVTWAHQELPEYPEAGAMRNIGLASVRMACIVPASGRFEECRILYEAPEGLGFGRNALAAARGSSVALPPGDLSDVGKVVQFTMRFRMPGD